ncbi:lipase 3 [Drosophila serrata]|uniref:lipase 3 n=1 Tax=Drosophila serrata TaxID=7274 RepID=UPI000A1CFF7D|nr:lipase 3 [Drosophila serrata]
MTIIQLRLVFLVLGTAVPSAWSNYYIPYLDSVPMPRPIPFSMASYSKIMPIASGSRSSQQCGQCKLQSYFTENDIQTDAKLNTLELIAKYGFPSENHIIQTADGYKLSLHRMPRPGAKPVLLVHGLMSSSACWVQLGPSLGLAYLLYLKGFDVWMLNTRGNIYSRDHVRGRIPDSEYWDFSYHEIGTHDLPAAVDAIIQKTNQQQIQYIGHSQGSTAFFVMSSEKPQYANKISLMQSLSPTVYLEHNRSPVLKFLSVFNGGFALLIELLGGHQISLTTSLIKKFSKHICSLSVVTSRICAIFDFILCGFNWQGFNQTLSPIIEGHSSQGASAKQILHYAQQQGQQTFQRYDYGKVLNLLRYKAAYPPQYNLSQVNSKVQLYSGSGDWIGSFADATRLQNLLPNCIGNTQVASEGFSHYDFTISNDIRSLVYDQVMGQCQNN